MMLKRKVHPVVNVKHVRPSPSLVFNKLKVLNVLQ